MSIFQNSNFMLLLVPPYSYLLVFQNQLVVNNKKIINYDFPKILGLKGYELKC